MASYKVKICLKKKNPPRAQIFRYFRIESRNKKLDFRNFPLYVSCNLLHAKLCVFNLVLLLPRRGGNLLFRLSLRK